MMRGRREINMIPAVALGGVIYAAMAVVVGGVPDMPTGMQTLWIVIMGFVVTTPATALLALGPRYISSPEVGLIVLLETVLGPLWVWLVIHEAPGALALVGGAVVVATLLVHSLLSSAGSCGPIGAALATDDALAVALACNRHFCHRATAGIAGAGTGGIGLRVQMPDTLAQALGLHLRRNAVAAADLTHKAMQPAIVAMQQRQIGMRVVCWQLVFDAQDLMRKMRVAFDQSRK